MIITIIILCVILVVVECKHCFTDGWLLGVGVVAGFIALVVAVCLGVAVSNGAVIDDKIAMYQEENAKIEEQIERIVSEYMEYEAEVFENAKVDTEGVSDIILVSLYPELKSDTLVQSQIEVYLSNNQKIKNLRESEINQSVLRWWLYFGK